MRAREHTCRSGSTNGFKAGNTLQLRSYSRGWNSYESVANRSQVAELGSRIIDRVILKLQRRPEFLLIEFFDALVDVLREHKFQKRLKLPVVVRKYFCFSSFDAVQTRDRR